MYNEIRNKILEYPRVFEIIRFFFTPIRVTKEFILRRKLAKVLINQNKDIKKNDKKIFYFGIPEHNNLGDLAQTFCTNKWIKQNYPDYKIIQLRTRVSFDKTFIKYLKSILNELDIFIFQSGYCTRDKNPDHLMHLFIMKRFPNQRAVILPQTVKLVSKKEIEKTKSIFSNCNHFLFITRDHISYDKAAEFLHKEQIALFPDIVTSMIGHRQVVPKRDGMLFCVRNDGEKYYSDEKIHTAIEYLHKVTPRIDITDTNIDIDVQTAYNDLEGVIQNKVADFSRYRVIITDRYHGTIFSLIANTPVVIIKTNDHKVTAGYEWFKGIFDEDSIRLAKDLNEAIAMAEQIYQKPRKIQNSDYFYREYYQSKLFELIEQL